jgi:hypothetical protein
MGVIYIKSYEMNNKQLLEHRNQIEKDVLRLYEGRNFVGTPLYESLGYLNYLCNKRNIIYESKM